MRNIDHPPFVGQFEDAVAAKATQRSLRGLASAIAFDPRRRDP